MKPTEFAIQQQNLLPVREAVMEINCLATMVIVNNLY
jgi:hypothetical protein